MDPETFEELTKYLDEVLAKSHGTRLVLVGRTIPVPSRLMPGQPEYVKFGFFEERPIGKNRLDFAHELTADLNILVGEAKAAYLKDRPMPAPKAPATQPTPPTSSAPPTSAKKPAQPENRELELLLNGLQWSDANDKGYQWCYRDEAEAISSIKQFTAEMDQMTQKWRRCGAYSYILSGDNKDLLGRIPWPPGGRK